MEQDYKVKDISLAEFGRKEISLAETEMPGLIALRIQRKISTKKRKNFRLSSHDNSNSSFNRNSY